MKPNDIHRAGLAAARDNLAGTQYKDKAASNLKAAEIQDDAVDVDRPLTPQVEQLLQVGSASTSSVMYR